MADYQFTLGGEVFTIPSLPWKTVKAIYPDLVSIVNDLGFTKYFGEKEETFEKLTGIFAKSIALSDKPEKAGQIEELPISVGEAAAAALVICQACGLKLGGSEGASDDLGK